MSVSASRASSRRWRARAGSAAAKCSFGDQRTLGGDAPERRDEARVPDVGRRVARRAFARRDSGCATGCTCPSASTIGCRSDPLNGSTVMPSVVVPSGKIATTSPRASAVAASRLIAVRVPPPRRARRTACRRSPTSHPTTGQRRSSALATKRAGCSASGARRCRATRCDWRRSAVAGHAAVRHAVEARLDVQDREQPRRPARGRCRAAARDRSNGNTTSVVRDARTTWSPIRAVRATRDAIEAAHGSTHQRYSPNCSR